MIGLPPPTRELVDNNNEFSVCLINGIWLNTQADNVDIGHIS